MTNIKAKHLRFGDVTTDGVVEEDGPVLVIADDTGGVTVVSDPDQAVTLVSRR